MDTFHLTRETETDTLECIYTARIEAWTVADWTRDTTVHLNPRDLVSYLCLFQQQQQQQKKKKEKKSHIEIIECGVWSGFTVCKNSLAIFLGITKSHSRMYLKWTSQNLTSFANSLSLSLSLSMESSFVLPPYKYDTSPFEL